MTAEEMLIAENILARNGYRYIWRYGRPPDGYCLRARRYPALSVRGLREKVIVVECAEDMTDVPLV